MIDSLAATDNSAELSKRNSTSNYASELGQNEFLTLMLAQLKNQDPLKPSDPTEFLSQLAQFSTVTSVQNMESEITELADALRSTQALNGAALVGRDVLAAGDTAVHTSGTSLSGAVTVPEGVTEVQVSILGNANQVIRRFNMPAAAGFQPFSWDGLTDGGTAAESGQYKISIIANNGGAGESLSPLLSSRVDSVTIDPTGLLLNTSNGVIPLKEVQRVK
jgi:flagellar basal-body rod modification protein FlgD